MNETKIKEILANKRQGQDCAESESAELKQFVLNATLTVANVEMILAIEHYFPAEYSEALEMMPPDVRQKHLDQTAELTVQANQNDDNTKSADDLIDDIASHLRECDGKFIAEIANKVLDKNVKYLRDSFFEVE